MACWGMPYRVVLNRLSSGFLLVETLPSGVISEIVRTLSPRFPTGDNQPTPSVWGDELAVTGSEVVEACSRITPGRAPEPDGITRKRLVLLKKPNLALLLPTDLPTH